MFISLLYMFRAPMCSSSGESIVSIRYLVYVTLCRWPSGMRTRRSPTWSDIYRISYWYNLFSWWWTHGRSKHVEKWSKHIRKRIVRQVGYLQELCICFIQFHAPWRWVSEVQKIVGTGMLYCGFNKTVCILWVDL